MPRLRYVGMRGWPGGAPYRSSALPGVVWAVGEERDVSESMAAGLLREFDDAFVVVDGGVVAPVVNGPPADRMVRGPTRARR